MLHMMEVDSYSTPFSSSKVRGSAGLPLANFRHHKPTRTSKRERSPEESEVEVDRPLKRVASGHLRAKIPLSRGSSQQPSENYVKQADGPKTDSLSFQTSKYDQFATVNKGQSSAVAGPGECDVDGDVDMAVEDIVEAEVQMDTQEAPQPQPQSFSVPHGSQRQSGQQRPSKPHNVLSSRHPYGRLCLHYAHSDPLINVVPATPADSLQSLHQNLGQAASTTQNQAMLSPHHERMGTPPHTSENPFQQEPGLSSRHRKRVITFGPRSNCTTNSAFTTIVEDFARSPHAFLLSVYLLNNIDITLQKKKIAHKMSTTLPLFWHLSSASKKERIDASFKLIGALEHFQLQFTEKAAPATAPEDEDDDNEDVGKSNDTLDVLNAQDVSYSIRRLIRGLASPRESSRLGFAVTLTELLSRLDTVTCHQILGLITDTTKQHGSMNGQEERDILFARLFGAMSVIQSGLAVRTTPLPSLSCPTTFASSAESYEEIIQLLVALGDQKSWLRESAWFTISLAVDVLNDSEVPWKGEAVTKTLDTLFVKHTVWSIEKLALAVKLQDFYPAHDWRSYLPPNFKDADVLSTGNLSIITRIMKESSSDEEETKDLLKAPSGCWRPQLNFSWNIILDQVLPSPNSKVTKGSFQDFYRIVVDETLFSSTSSVSRKYWGFQVFQKALKKVDQESMPMLFTKNFMRTWINHLSKKDRHLHKISLQTATEVQAFVKDKPYLGFSLILQLTGVNGSQQFDKLTKTKTVESILSSLDAKGVQSYIDYLFSQVNDVSSANVTAINARRAWVIEQLAALVRNHRLPREDNWVKNVLDWLAIHGLFVITKRSSKSPFTALRTIPNPVLSDELRQTCREKLLLCLGDLNRQAAVISEGDSKNKIQGAASDGEYWISKVSSTIQDLEGDSKHVVPADEVDKRERALRVKAREIIGRVKTISTAQQEDAKGAELLLLGSLLNRYCAEDDEGHSDSDTLEICIEGVSKLLFADDQKSKNMKSKDDAEEAEPEPVDLLVDTIIDFLERGTSYLRTLGIQVFSLLSGSIKESTVDLIVTQLERRDIAQQSKVEDEEEGMEGDEENEDDVSEKSDSEENSEKSNPEHSDEGSDGGETDLELRRKVEEALRVDGIELTTGATDSEEEELMDDEQMMAIDERLAEVFRSRANEKKKANGVDAQREATHFKNRVLDLVDVYLKKQHSNPLALRFITPLSMLIIGCGQDERQLADKAKGILRSRIGKTKEIPVGVNPSHVVEISTTIHGLAQKARSSDILAILGLCSIYLVKIAIQVKEDSFIDLYKQDLLDFTTRKNSGLNGTFFQEFIKRYPSYAWRMRQDFLDSTSKTINTYRQIQVIQLLQLLLNLLPSYNPSNDEVMTFMASLKQQLLGLAENACKDSGSLTTAQMKELLKLVLSSVRQTARIAPTTAWKSEEWRSLSDKLKNSPRFKTSPVLQKLCKRIVHACETPGPEASGRQSKKAGSSKRKAEDVEAEAEEKDVPHKNKKQRHRNAKAN